MSVILKTQFLSYEISDSGINKSFLAENKEERIIQTPAAFITNSDRSEIPSVKASLDCGILSLEFADGTVAALDVAQKPDYITFTLKSVSREDFLSISFLNISLCLECGAKKQSSNPLVNSAISSFTL